MFQTTGWKGEGSVWIGGGQDLHGKWEWHGRVETEIIVGSWGNLEPNDSGSCLALVGQSDRSGNYSWDDYNCKNPRHFVCEKTI